MAHYSYMADSKWIECLNSDGNQFNKYQQNEQSALILTELTEHKKDHDIWRI
jgi:hypothetical protein